MRKKITKKFDWGTFVQKGLIRLAYRLIELIVLFGLGWSVGLKLIKY